VSKQLTEMTSLQLQFKDGSSASKENALILDVMVKYQQAKMKLISLSDASSQLDKTKNELNDTRTQLEQARQTIRMYQSAGGNY
jgi:hypothetical protein